MADLDELFGSDSEDDDDFQPQSVGRFLGVSVI